MIIYLIDKQQNVSGIDWTGIDKTKLGLYVVLDKFQNADDALTSADITIINNVLNSVAGLSVEEVRGFL